MFFYSILMVLNDEFWGIRSVVVFY